MTKHTYELKVKDKALLVVCVIFSFFAVICTNILACPCSPTCSNHLAWLQYFTCETKDCKCIKEKWYFLSWNIAGTCCPGVCNIKSYHTGPIEKIYPCSGDTCNPLECYTPPDPIIIQGNIPDAECTCCPTPCNPANCEECVDCSCQPCGGNPNKTCCHGRRCCNAGENCCDDGHCCPDGKTCCGSGCCNPANCEECVEGVCSPGYCTLATIEIDESSCTCQESACQGSGQIYYFYMCYNDHCPDSCYCKSTKSLQVTEQVPWCQDIGYWPPGSACDENEDCAILGWESDYGNENDSCGCVANTP